MEVFSACHEINDKFVSGDHVAARNLLIQLLAAMQVEEEPYQPIVNELIRITGLFPYLKLDDATWDQRFVYEAFAVDVGNQSATLHREQSLVLSKLIQGIDLAISAPTSFGKSFIIDAFIALKRPKTVVIIVPTIALMDETRRRLFRKFSRDYDIITAPETDLGERNILVFPAERAFGYLNVLENIDLLVIDEFYKASSKHDKDRAPALVKAIIKLTRKADQRYFLAPNIKSIGDNPLTNGMEFLELLDFNTVFLKRIDLWKEINGDEGAKSKELISIIGRRSAKSLVYAGTYSEIDKVGELVKEKLSIIDDRPHTAHFASWLRRNYKSDWGLADLVERGVGVHNGQLHRCLSQLQIQIFEHPKGFDTIVSTSSIIEGVNTSAENVIIWKSKLGGGRLKDFTFKNIIGRSGRMFKHFIGSVYLLDAPPEEEQNQLEIEFPEQILGDLEENDLAEGLTDAQLERIIGYREAMSEILGVENFRRLKAENLLQDSDSEFLLNVASDMRQNPNNWSGFAYLNSSNPEHWERMLYNIVKLKPGGWDTRWSNVVKATKILAENWRCPMPDMIQKLEKEGISIEEFFKLERTITFKMSSLLSDVNHLHGLVIGGGVDISSFVRNVGHAFLPGAVYHLEEYGLPRMISKKLQNSGVIDFEAEGMNLHRALRELQSLGSSRIQGIGSLDAFDRYVVRFFFAGITQDQAAG